MITYFTDIEIIGLISAYICWLISIIIFVKGKSPKLAILMLSVGCLIWNVQGVSYDVFLNLWDERFHALVARNLADDFLKPQLYTEKLLLDFDYRDWPRAQIWLHKQPFFLWLGAVFIKFFGFSPFVWRLPFAILFSFVPLIAWRVGSLLADTRVGYYSAMLSGGSYWAFLLLTGRVNTDQNDLCFFVLVSASIWTFTEYASKPCKKWIIWTGIFSGLAVLTKWLPGLMIYSAWFIWILIHYKSDTQIRVFFDLFKSFTLAGMVFIPWQIYTWIKFPVETHQEFEHAGKHFFEVIENHSEEWHYYFTDNLLELYGWPVALFIMLGIAVFFKSKSHNLRKTQLRYSLLAMFVGVYLFYTLAATKMPSFVFPVSMILFVILGNLLEKIITYIHTYISTIIEGILIVSILLYLFDFEQIQNTYKRTQTHEYTKVQTDIARSIYKIQMYLPPGSVVFNVHQNYYVDVMALTGHTAYPVLPDDQVLDTLRSLNRQAVVLQEKEILPDFIMKDSSIIKLPIQLVGYY